MSLLGNLIWLIFGGLVVALIYFVIGLVFCLTIIGIPFGWQLMKLGAYALAPFGKEPDFKEGEPGCLSTVMNVIWVLTGWWEIAVTHVVFGALLCITIIGIPLGLQHFKMALLAFLPFGRTAR